MASAPLGSPSVTSRLHTRNTPPSNMPTNATDIRRYLNVGAGQVNATANPMSDKHVGHAGLASRKRRLLQDITPPVVPIKIRIVEKESDKGDYIECQFKEEAARFYGVDLRQYFDYRSQDPNAVTSALQLNKIDPLECCDDVMSSLTPTSNAETKTRGGLAAGRPPAELSPFKATSVTSRAPTLQYDASIRQELIAERVKQEAYVAQRISELQREGLWAEKRLPKVQEPPRNKAHWDYLLEEMTWLSADFVQERKWKKANAKKCAKMVQKYFQDKETLQRKEEKSQELKLRRIANFMAKEVKNFWANVNKVSHLFACFCLLITSTNCSFRQISKKNLPIGLPVTIEF